MTWLQWIRGLQTGVGGEYESGGAVSRSNLIWSHTVSRREPILEQIRFPTDPPQTDFNAWSQILGKSERTNTPHGIH